VNEAERVFNDTVRERKRTGWGAHNTVSAKRGRCRLPHENMTRKERESMNGEVIVMNPNRAMTWEEFTAMPPDMQERYYNTVAERHGAGMSDMARMFGAEKSRVASYIRRKGINIVRRPHAWKMPQAYREAWDEFCGVTVDTSKPMTWTEWTALSPKLKTEYYNGVSREFHATMLNMATMFGIQPQVLRNYISKENLPVWVPQIGEAMSAEDAMRWVAFRAGEPVEEPAEEPAEVPAEVPVEATAEEEPVTEVMPLVSYNMEFRASRWEDIMATLMHLPIPDGASIRVSVG